MSPPRARIGRDKGFQLVRFCIFPVLRARIGTEESVFGSPVNGDKLAVVTGHFPDAGEAVWNNQSVALEILVFFTLGVGQGQLAIHHQNEFIAREGVADRIGRRVILVDFHDKISTQVEGVATRTVAPLKDLIGKDKGFLWRQGNSGELVRVEPDGKRILRPADCIFAHNL